MNNQPLMLSILLGIILILIIGGVSLSVQKSKATNTINECLSEKIDLQKFTGQLEEENQKLKSQAEELQSRLTALEEDKKALSQELEKTQRLKETIEDRLKEELVREEPAAK